MSETTVESGSYGLHDTMRKGYEFFLVFLFIILVNNVVSYLAN